MGRMLRLRAAEPPLAESEAKPQMGASWIRVLHAPSQPPAKSDNRPPTMASQFPILHALLQVPAKSENKWSIWAVRFPILHALLQVPAKSENKSLICPFQFPILQAPPASADPQVRHWLTLGRLRRLRASQAKYWPKHMSSDNILIEKRPDGRL